MKKVFDVDLQIIQCNTSIKTHLEEKKSPRIK